MSSTDLIVSPSTETAVTAVWIVPGGWFMVTRTGHAVAAPAGVELDLPEFDLN